MKYREKGYDNLMIFLREFMIGANE